MGRVRDDVKVWGIPKKGPSAVCVTLQHVLQLPNLGRRLLCCKPVARYSLPQLICALATRSIHTCVAPHTPRAHLRAVVVHIDNACAADVAVVGRGGLEVLAAVAVAEVIERTLHATCKARGQTLA